MSKIPVSSAYSGLRSFIKQSVLFSDANKPNGQLGYERLNNSLLEDVIIQPLAMNYGKVLQTGVLNVNIFVLNLILNVQNTGEDRSQPNLPRLSYLEQLAMNALTPGDDSDAIYANGYSYTFQQSNIVADTNDQHFINIRIEFNAITF